MAQKHTIDIKLYQRAVCSCGWVGNAYDTDVVTWEEMDKRAYDEARHHFWSETKDINDNDERLGG